MRLPISYILAHTVSNISYFYCWSLWETVTGWAPVDLYFLPMLARTALPPNANFGLSDWS